MPAAALPATEHDLSNSSIGGLTVRPATVADADALADVDRRLADVNALVCARDAAVWRYEIAGRLPADLARRVVAVLVHGRQPYAPSSWASRQWSPRLTQPPSAPK